MNAFYKLPQGYIKHPHKPVLILNVLWSPDNVVASKENCIQYVWLTCFNMKVCFKLYVSNISTKKGNCFGNESLERYLSKEHQLQLNWKTRI